MKTRQPENLSEMFYRQKFPHLQYIHKCTVCMYMYSMYVHVHVCVYVSMYTCKVQTMTVTRSSDPNGELHYM